MNAGETKTVTIPAEDAYGTWNITLAVESGFGPDPIDSILNRTITENRSSFEYLFSDVNLAINSTFDYGETIFFISDILNATITQLNSTDITYKLMPKDNATFLLPLFNWNVTFHVYNESSFTIHSDVHVNHSFSDTEFGEPIHFKIVSVNETDAIMAMNVGAPDISYIDQPITYDIKVLAVHKTS